MSHLHRQLFLLLLLLLPVQLGKHFWPEFSLVLGIRVDYLSPTIYLTDLLVVGILISWGLESLNKLKTQIANLKSTSKILKLLLFLSPVFLINILVAKNQPAAFYKLAKIIEFVLLGFYIARNRYKLSALRYPLAIAVVYSSLIALVQFFKQASLGGVFWWLGERTFNAGTPGIAKAIIDGQLLMRPYATFPHPNVLAGFFLVSLILTAPLLLKRNRLLFTFYFLLVSTALILSFSRSAWFVGLLMAGIFLVKKFVKRPKFIILNSLFTIIFLGGIFLFKSKLFSEEAFWQRLDLTRSALLMTQIFPLFGVGLNNFIVRLPEFWSLSGQTYLLQPVHNIYLLIAAETGLVGLAIFLWFLVLTFRQLAINNSGEARSRPARQQLTIALTAILLLGFFDHYWLTLQQTQLMFTIILGLAWTRERA